MNNSLQGQFGPPSGEQTEETTSKEDNDDDEDSEKKEEETEKEQPPFDKLIVGGTLSLAIMMLIGAVGIGIISWVSYARLDGASTDDFVSLGAESCWVQSSVSYEIQEVALDRLNALCNEDYRYQVLIVGSTNNGETFTSITMSSTACRRACETCNNFDGPDFYVGTESNRPGFAIPPIDSDDDSRLLVECWVSRGPVEELSNYYDCGENNDLCGQLKDPSADLQDDLNSNLLGVIAAGVGLFGAVVLGLAGYYFVQRNRKWAEEKARNDPSHDSDEASVAN